MCLYRQSTQCGNSLSERQVSGIAHLILLLRDLDPGLHGLGSSSVPSDFFFCPACVVLSAQTDLNYLACHCQKSFLFLLFFSDEYFISPLVKLYSCILLLTALKSIFLLTYIFNLLEPSVYWSFCPLPKQGKVLRIPCLCPSHFTSLL